MTTALPVPQSPLRQRLIEDMNMRRFARFAAFHDRPPDPATGEEVRRFQIEQREAGVAAGQRVRHEVQ